MGEWNSPRFTRGFTRGYGGGRLVPDHGNRHYVVRGGWERGGWGRGGRGRGAGSSPTSANFPPEADIKEGLDASNVIETIPTPPRPIALEEVPIENVQYVSSYNWVDAEKRTIIAPGSPAIWTERDVPFSLEPDTDAHLVDQNSARMSEYPLLPLFAAADAIHDDKKAPVDWPAVDVVTDRNALRKLMRWLNPSEGKEVRDFRIDVERAGDKTVVLNRWEPRLSEPALHKSYGFAFEAATSRAAPGCPGSDHYRAITYDMLDMKMIVRFEVDSCLATDTSTATTTETETSDTKRSTEEAHELAVDDIADALENINIVTSSRAPTSPTTTLPSSTSHTPSSPSTALNVIRAGTQVPQESLLEVASRSKFYIDKLDWNELYPQLIISQTQGLRLGIHERGTFFEMREMQVDGDGDDNSSGVPPVLETQKRETAAQLVRLARVLEDIQEIAISRGPGPTGSFSLVCESGELRVYGRKGVRRSCLPPDVWTRFSRAGAPDAPHADA